MWVRVLLATPPAAARRHPWVGGWRHFHQSASAHAPLLSPYTTLSIPSDASTEQIRVAYFRLAKQCHPDVNASPDAVVRFRHLTAAYALLRCPERRARFDASGDADVDFGASSFTATHDRTVFQDMLELKTGASELARELWSDARYAAYSCSLGWSSGRAALLRMARKHVVLFSGLLAIVLLAMFPPNPFSPAKFAHHQSRATVHNLALKQQMERGPPNDPSQS